MSKKIRWASIVRWLHTYTSLVVFAALLFFSITGITLNHARTFEEGGERRRDVEFTCPVELCPKDGDIAREALAEWTQKKFSLRGVLGDFTSDADQVSFVFKGPAYSADVAIERATGKSSIREERLGKIAFLDDLHKGRDSGKCWSLFIDVSAGVMAVASLTGLWLLFYVRRRRRSGLIVTLIGLIVMIVLAMRFTP